MTEVPGGLHALTPEGVATAELVRRVGAVLDAGVGLLQYRDKGADRGRQKEQIAELLPLCRRHGVPLVINDDWELALETGADGVHLGPEDSSPELVRREIGETALLGASCRSDPALAERAAAHCDYLAFGCCFPSRTKPDAPPLPLRQWPQLLDTAARVGRAAVAIGGIDSSNLSRLSPPPQAIAVCAALFAAPDSGRAARELCEAFAALQQNAQ